MQMEAPFTWMSTAGTRWPMSSFLKRPLGWGTPTRPPSSTPLMTTRYAAQTVFWLIYLVGVRVWLSNSRSRPGRVQGWHFVGWIGEACGSENPHFNRDVRVQILIWFQTLLFTKPHFQTFNALKSTSFQIISDFFRLFSHRCSHTPVSSKGVVCDSPPQKVPGVLHPPPPPLTKPGSRGLESWIK